MRKFFVPVVLVAFALAMSGVAMAASTATQTVTFQVSSINELSVSGDPGALDVNAAVAGSQPTEVSDNSTTYAITTNGSTMKLTGAIDSAMPSGVTLKANLAAPTASGTSAGDVSLSTTAADLVTSITQVAEGSLSITYKLDATVAAGVVASSTKTVTLTLVQGP